MGRSNKSFAEKIKVAEILAEKDVSKYRIKTLDGGDYFAQAFILGLQILVVAKDYPPQMQDLVIVDFVQQFIGTQVGPVPAIFCVNHHYYSQSQFLLRKSHNSIHNKQFFYGGKIGICKFFY